MPIATTIAALTAVAGTFGYLARRDARRARFERKILLDACLEEVAHAKIEHGGDGFPRLQGAHQGYQVRAELIPDTMTIRRLPQLWLSVTLVAPVPVPAEFAILVRASGNDFFSLTERFGHYLQATAGMPWEVLAKGSGEQAQQLLESISEPLEAILADPRIKEIAVTQRGLRIVRQAAEGQRGDHVLMRQAVFEDASVPAAVFATTLAQLHMLHASLMSEEEAIAA